MLTAELAVVCHPVISDIIIRVQLVEICKKHDTISEGVWLTTIE